MVLTLQDTHDTREDAIIQNVLINGVVVEKHFCGQATVSGVKCTQEGAYEWFACIYTGRGDRLGFQAPRISRTLLSTR